MKFFTTIIVVSASIAFTANLAGNGFFKHFDEPFVKPQAMANFQKCYEKVIAGQSLTGDSYYDGPIRNAAVKTCKSHLKGRWIVPNGYQ